MSEDAQMRECAQEEQKPATTVFHMRLAKASQADLDAAYRVMNLLDCMDRGYYPSNEEGSPTFFDSDDWEHLQFLHQQIIEIADNSGGVSRVIGAAGILLNEENGLIDPDDDCIEPHPDLKAMNKDKEEVKQLRARVEELEKEVKSSKEMETLRYCEQQWSDERTAFFKRIAELEAERAEREKQEPVAWYVDDDEGREYNGAPEMSGGRIGIPLYAAPPSTAPVLLTDGFVFDCGFQHGLLLEDADSNPDVAEFAREIESATLRANGFKVDGSEPSRPVLTPEQVEKADEAIREALGYASDMREWDAWSYGTMGPDDFWPVAESDERVAEIRNAAAAALGFTVEG